jgi:CBS domain-containing protein
VKTVKDCIAQKTQRTISVASTDTVQRALEMMKEHRVRAVLVIDSDQLVGIISQGDCAIRALLPGKDAKTTRVSEIMTRDPITVKPGDPMEFCMGLMATRSIRHLPVLGADQVIGVVSIGDVVKEMMNDLSQQVSFLETYIKGHSA